MRIAYLDCFSGVSGNMLLAAVIAAGTPAAWLRAEIKKVLGGFKLVVTPGERNWLAGTHVRVDYPRAGQPHRRLRDIERMIGKSKLAAPVREKSVAVFQRLAEAEGAVHGIGPGEVHFHEVGAVDAIVDVVGSVAGLTRLGIDELTCSPLPMSGGEVECAHGTLPVPAPATLELLRRRHVPIRGVPVAAELVTPTGAALVTTLAAGFGPMPAMTVTAVGVGLGDRDLGRRANLLRLIVGERAGAGETLIQLEAAIDDMPAEHFDYLIDRLHAAGAREVLLVPAQMKKNRPGTLVRVLADPERHAAVQAELFQHSTTLGVRAWEVSRASLPRRVVTVKTAYGPIKAKLAARPGAGETAHLEYDDLKRAAQSAGASLAAVERAALAALPAARKAKA